MTTELTACEPELNSKFSHFEFFSGRKIRCLRHKITGEFYEQHENHFPSRSALEIYLKALNAFTKKGYEFLRLPQGVTSLCSEKTLVKKMIVRVYCRKSGRSLFDICNELAAKNQIFPAQLLSQLVRDLENGITRLHAKKLSPGAFDPTSIFFEDNSFKFFAPNVESYPSQRALKEIKEKIKSKEDVFLGIKAQKHLQNETSIPKDRLFEAEMAGIGLLLLQVTTGLNTAVLLENEDLARKILASHMNKFVSMFSNSPELVGKATTLLDSNFAEATKPPKDLNALITPMDQDLQPFEEANFFNESLSDTYGTDVITPLQENEESFFAEPKFSIYEPSHYHRSSQSIKRSVSVVSTQRENPERASYAVSPFRKKEMS